MTPIEQAAIDAALDKPVYTDEGLLAMCSKKKAVVK
jgi:hypothetical protein